MSSIPAVRTSKCWAMCSSSLCTIFREKAIEFLGAAAVEAAQYYGFRVNRNPSGGYQLQCIVKVPSGAVSQIFVRDFLDRSAQPDDMTVLPRFWPASSSGLHQVIATAQGLPGFAGLQVTKRGLAVRAWISKLAEARRIFMTDDERICEANLATVPKVLYNAAGWPAGVRPASLVECVQKATKQAPVPTSFMEWTSMSFPFTFCACVRGLSLRLPRPLHLHHP